MHSIEKTRFEQFSDGVFAIAITLLAFELHAPSIHGTSIATAATDLTSLVPAIATFVISFVTIAIFWVNHHQLTQILKTINRRRILWANMLFLLFLTLIPFVTQSTIAYPSNPLTVLSYSLALCGASASFTMLRYCIHSAMGERHIPMSRSLFGPILYLLAAAVALVSVVGCYTLLAIPALYYFLPKKHS